MLRTAASLTTRRECQAVPRGDRHHGAVEEDFLESIPEDSPEMEKTLQAIDCEHVLSLASDRLGEPCHSLLSALYLEEPAPDYRETSRRIGRPIGSLGPTRTRCLAKLQKLYRDSGGKKP